MQLLNTDFETNVQSENLSRDVVKQFKSHFESHEKHTCHLVDKFAATTDVTVALREEQVLGITKIWLHSMILGERMTLNYSRYVVVDTHRFHKRGFQLIVHVQW